MALTYDEQEALKELKKQGYSFADAMGFLASNRMGNVSKVERELTTPQEKIEPSDAVSDIKKGFEGAKQSFDSGMERTDKANQRSSAIGRTSGKIGAGFRFAGEAIGNILGGGIRALPGGTTAMNKAEEVIGGGVQKLAQSPLGQGAAKQFNKLPEGVKQGAGDVGNVFMGAAGLADALVAPGATKAFSMGFKEFASAGVRGFGDDGIKMAIDTGLAPEDIMQRVARVSKGKQADFERRSGESVGEYLVNRGIFGDPDKITEQLYQRMQTSKGRVDAGLSKIGGQFKNDSVADALDALADREARVSTTRVPSKDSARVNELLKKHGREGLTLSEVNEVKRLYERNVKLDYLRDNVSDKIAQANEIDSALRNFVEETADKNGFKNVKALNKETTLAKQLLDDLGAEYAGQQGNNFVSLSDAMFLAEAASNPSALLAFGLKKGIGSKSAMSAVARLIAGKRQALGLPDAEIDLPRLPAPVGDITRVPDAQTIKLGDRSQSTIDAQEALNPNIGTTAKGYQSTGKVEITGVDSEGNLQIIDAGNVLVIPANELPVIQFGKKGVNKGQSSSFKLGETPSKLRRAEDDFFEKKPIMQSIKETLKDQSGSVANPFGKGMTGKQVTMKLKQASDALNRLKPIAEDKLEKYIDWASGVVKVAGEDLINLKADVQFIADRIGVETRVGDKELANNIRGVLDSRIGRGKLPKKSTTL